MSRRGESIYKRKDGRWEARYIHHYENGKAKYRFIYASTYAEVKAKRLEEMKLPQNIPAPKAKANVNFRELGSQWLADIKTRVKESTYTRYYHIVKRYLHPYLGELRLVKIDIGKLNELIQHLLYKGSVKHQALSAKTVSDILCVLKAIFKFGRENGYPCVTLDALKPPPKMKKITNIIPQSNLRIIEEKLIHSKDLTSLGILFALYTGVRIGELCGLRWEDIDLDSATVTIRRTVERIADISESAKKTKVIVSEPKTRNSVRVIPLPSFLTTILKAHCCAGTCYVLTGSQKHTEPHQYYMRYKRWMKKLGFDEYTFHALRHTFATRCVEIGFDTKSLSEILGHANVNTTLAIYVHPTLEQKRTQMERLSLYGS